MGRKDLPGEVTSVRLYQQFIGCLQRSRRLAHQPGEFIIVLLLQNGAGRWGRRGSVRAMFEIISSSDEFLHMLSRLRGQIALQDPKIPAMRFSYSPADRSGTAVVCRKHEEPVPEFTMQVTEIFCSGPRTLVIVLPLVGTAVDFQTQNMSRGSHQLPGTFRTDTAGGSGFQLRLDDGKIFQLLGQSIMVQHRVDDRERAIASLSDACKTIVVIPDVAG